MNLLFKKILTFEPPKLRLFFSLLSDAKESLIPFFVGLIASLKQEEQGLIIDRFKGILNTDWLKEQVQKAETPNNQQKLLSIPMKS